MRGHLLTVIGTLIFGITASGLISMYIHHTDLVQNCNPEPEKVKVNS